MQFSALYCSSVQLNTMQYSTVQSGNCSAVQFSAFKFSAMKIIFVPVLLSAQVKEFSAFCVWNFFFRDYLCEKNIFIVKKIWLLFELILSFLYISFVK